MFRFVDPFIVFENGPKACARCLTDCVLGASQKLSLVTKAKQGRGAVGAPRPRSYLGAPGLVRTITVPVQAW